MGGFWGEKGPVFRDFRVVLVCFGVFFSRFSSDSSGFGVFFFFEIFEWFWCVFFQ